MSGQPWENVVYTNHDYALPGFVDGGPYPGVSRGKYVDKEILEQTFIERSSYMLEHYLPIWVGEFGARLSGQEEADAIRAPALADRTRDLHPLQRQLGHLDLQGHRFAGGRVRGSGSPWVECIRPILRKKAHPRRRPLGRDEHGDPASHEPLERLFAESIPKPILSPSGPSAT